MYISPFCCGINFLIHLLAKHPVLILALGLSGTFGMMTKASVPKSCASWEQIIKEAEIEQIRMNPRGVLEAKQLQDAFASLKPRIPIREIRRKSEEMTEVVQCDPHEILNLDDPTTKNTVAFLYFLDLVHKHGIEGAEKHIFKQ